MSHGFPFRLSLGCSALALATALAAPAAAQSFQGNATVVFGSANVVQGTGTTNVNVGSASAVIDWAPFDTAIGNGTQINWQPAGTTATYTGTAGNFAVLNRIVPVDTSRPIAFNGTVVSQFLQGQAAVRGGTVFFYSPGGIVLSPTAVFDVGNLGLTTAPPMVDANGGWYTNNTVQFGQAASNSSVRIEQGAQIGASAQGSYVAAFAPKIEQFGAITVDGQVALVAGEAGSVTFSPDGLFNIQVTLGTDEAVAIDHRGTTTGPASSGVGDNHRVYMVAIPKNNAMQLAITRGSTIGFAIAGAANVVGNAVVLSAGRNVVAGGIGQAPVGGPGLAQLRIDDSTAGTGAGIDFTSAVTAGSTTATTVVTTRQTNFAADANLRGDTTASISVLDAGGGAGRLSIGGRLQLSTAANLVLAGTPDAGTAVIRVENGGSLSVGSDLIVFAGAGSDRNGNGLVQGGTARLDLLSGGSVTVGRDLLVDAQAFSDGLTGAPNANGGSALLTLVGNSSLGVTGVTRLTSYGIAGLNNGQGGQGADGRGGSSILTVQAGSTFQTNELNVAADGVGGADTGAGGGAGFGGTAVIDVADANSALTVASANVTGNVGLGERDMLSAEGYGGETAIANGVGGLAQGGSASILVTNGARLALPAQANAFARILARAYGGNASAAGSTGGEARAGSVAITVNAATLTGEALVPSSFAQGGGDPQQLATSVINGGNALGGTRTITLVNGATFTGSITGGGPSGVGGSGSLTGTGGSGTGGTATTTIDSSTVNVSSGGFLTFTQNTGGGGRVGGSASGGTASVSVINGSVVNLAAGARFGTTANAFSNGFGAGVVSTTGGNASAGSAVLTIGNATIQGNGGIVEVTADGQAGDGAVAGGAGRGGLARLDIANGSISVTNIALSAAGVGGVYAPAANAASGASGGAGIGGQASLILRGASLTATNIAIEAASTGGSVTAPGASGLTGGAGDGASAFAILQAASGTNTVTAGSVDIAATGSGGTLSAGVGNAGSGTGGEARIDALEGARLTVNATANILARGDGGSARFGGAGGAGTGGRAYSLAAAGAIGNGGGGTIAYGQDIFISAPGNGGDGDAPGAGRGGLAYLQSVANAVTSVAGNAFVRADANGGSHLGGAATGAAATGGSAQILATTGNARLTISGSASVSANAFGGPGVRDAAGAGGPGGNAMGGLAEIGGDGGQGNVLTISGASDLEANADAGYGDASSGGNAVGGLAVISAGNGTSLTFGGPVAVTTDAVGGAVFPLANVVTAASTRGGDATGGIARVRTFNSGGSITADSTVTVSAFARGGDVGDTPGDGGDAVSGRAGVIARDGAVAIAGALLVSSDAQGGAGVAGGNAAAIVDDDNEAFLLAANATVTVAGQAFLFASATGGSGREGGPGGSAVSGTAIVDASSSANGPSTITLTELALDSVASGGLGGSATSSEAGAGGAATSNAVGAFGTAGNGTLTVSGTTQLFSVAAGGTGGTSDTGAGGAGGAANSGYIQFGTKSGADVGAVNAGSASFADVSLFSQAGGGSGGASNTGPGGAGGDAIAAGGVLLVRGSPVTAATVSVIGIGLGGGGGSGTVQGSGGFGAAGAVSLTASQRFQRTERGSATLGTLSLLAVGQGGAGATPGASYYAGAGGVDLTQSDVTVGSLNFTTSGDLPPPAAVIQTVQPIKLTLANATLDVGDLTMTTPGEFLLDLDSSAIAAVTFAVNAGSFVLPALAPVQPGTVTVTDTLALSSGAGGSIRTYANFISTGDAFFSSGQDVVLGDIESEGLFEIEATGIVTVGDLDVRGARLTAGSDIQAGNIRSGAFFAARSTAGSVTIGTIDASDVTLEAASSLSARRITASSIRGQAGGLLAVLGPWTAPAITLIAADISIPDGGALAAGAGGSVDLVTNSPAGAFIGDGLAGQGGFRLGNAEFGRISGNGILIGVLDSPQNVVDMTIGALTLSASQLPGVAGSFKFASGDNALTPAGRIRVDGAIAGSGFAADQAIDFTTGSFEVNAETGSVSLSGNGVNGLGGIIEIDAANIHAASPAILARLRDNPRYDGVAEDLNAPAAAQRPEGVLRALGLVLYPEDTLYIQNTGTADNPAGFYTTLEGSDIEPPGFQNAQAPDVDLIINGRFAAQGADITGRDAYSAVVDNAESLQGFAESSQVNGCAFGAEFCAGGIAESPQLAVLQSEIKLLSSLALAEEPFDLVEISDEEDENAQSAARAPVEPPVVLIDTRPLNPAVDIADPVSGSGNPASLAAPEATTEPGDDQ